MKNQRERKGRKVGKKSIVPSFLTKLYQILENSEYHNIVRWAENGKAFVVKNLPDFIEQVLPSYFKHNNFASFVRQLNMYDFHKTRNSQNENTFYHKMFCKNQRNLLKLIKRKVNNSLRRSSIESNFSEIQECKISSKKSLEDVYLNLVKSLEEVSQRQNELEIKIISVENKNKIFIEENDLLTREALEKKSYAKNLEMLIILILEYFMLKKETTISNYLFEYKNQNFKNQNNIEEFGKPNNNLSSCVNSERINFDSKFSAINNSLCSLSSKFLMKNPNITLTSLAESINDDEKNNLLKNLKCEIKDDVIINLLDKNFIKKGVNKNEINVSLKTKSKKRLSERATSASSNINTTPNTIKNYDCETNMSTPTSLLSPNDILKGNMNLKINKFSILNTKRKRTDEIEVYELDSSGAINLNMKEKDSMFEEITRLTPCMITSPVMSPRNRIDSITRKNLNLYFIEGTSNIFTTHKNSMNYNLDCFYNFSNDDKNENQKIINLENMKM